MRGVWIRRLIPASVVSLVLVFSYFAPALGMTVAPVKSHDNPNCGRFGYGYHGGKHNFVCPTQPPPALPDVAQFGSATATLAPAVKSQAPAPSGGSAKIQPTGPLSVPVTKSVIAVPVSIGVNQWRGFTELVLRQLS
jgi:hypothetical protein